jgi:hypothetical protein
MRKVAGSNPRFFFPFFSFCTFKNYFVMFRDVSSHFKMGQEWFRDVSCCFVMFQVISRWINNGFVMFRDVSRHFKTHIRQVSNFNHT